MDQPTCHIDDFGPLPIHQPTSVSELGKLVRQTASENQAVYPIGGRTYLGFGFPPKKPGVAVDLTRLDQVIDYPARDMTITVQAGITVRRLQEVLATENQRLPVDIPLTDRATLGGALAVNASGPRRYGYGTLRDYVIGISVVNDEGQETKAGGRVVKNVAGYDLCKLYIGSLGTLGVITQVTLKVRPLPEQTVFLERTCRTDELAGLLAALHTSRTRPVCITALNFLTAQTQPGMHTPIFSTGWQILVGYEDVRSAVAWQVNQLQLEGASLNPPVWRLWPAADTDRLWTTLTDFPVTDPTTLSLKANLLPSRVADFCATASNLPDGLLIVAHAGNGIVYLRAPGRLTEERAQVIVTTLLEAATAARGNLVVLCCPPAWKRRLRVWGRQRGDAELMQAIKRQLDPRGLFNPGRFLDGI